MTVICPECNGLGEVVYNIVTGRDENKITVEKRKDICRTCNGSGEKKMTNADRIRAMSDEELAEFIRSMVDGSNSHPVACYGCINYGTHHSDPANKGTYLYECDGCENEGIGLDVLMWLQQPAEEE